MSRILILFAVLAVCGCGCEMLLPSGEPPKGGIVVNLIPEELSREELYLSLGGRIAASSMEHFPGGPVAVESDAPSRPVVRMAFREAAKICGVREARTAAAVLNAKQVRPNVFEFELFHFSRSLWRCTYILKKP